MDQEELKKIGYEIMTQDNRMTSEPLFCVFEKQRIYGLIREYSDKYEYYEGEKVYYVDVDKFVNAHFTNSAAKEYIRINGHNLNKPFVYVTSLNRYNEMILIRNFLKSNGK